MKNLTKSIVITIFALFAFGLLYGKFNSRTGTSVSAQTTTDPTPPAATPDKSPDDPEKKTDGAKAGDKKIPKDFTLGTDSFSEYGEVPFDHDTHAFEKYSPDGKSVVGCVECHHTDQPKSAMKPPLVTSERDVILTMEVWLKSDQKVSSCRSCHFQDGDVPSGKDMPVATYNERGRDVVKELNNELAYHINCNTCHDAAAELRPELKKKKGFATTNDCMICHLEN